VPSAGPGRRGRRTGHAAGGPARDRPFTLALPDQGLRHDSQTGEGIDRAVRRDVDFSLRQAATQVEQRLASCKQMLRGMGGLFDQAVKLLRPADVGGPCHRAAAGAAEHGPRPGWARCTS
jgi:hypothetical protein